MARCCPAVRQKSRRDAGGTEVHRGDNRRPESGAHYLLGSISNDHEREGRGGCVGFFEGLLVAPAADFFVVAAEENFGDVPAAE